MLPLYIASIEDADDRAYMGQLFEQFYRSAYKQARRFAYSSSDVEDIVEDAFLALLPYVEKLKQMDENGLQAYVHATVKSAGLAYVYKKNRSLETVDPMDYQNVAANNPDIDHNLLLKCDIGMLKDAIQRLSEGDQVILIMKYYLEMNDQSIAGKLAITHGAVRTRLTRARKRLYEIMREMFSDEDI